MLKELALFTAILSVAVAGVPAVHADTDLPDPKLTPGALNPKISQDNIDKTICNNHGANGSKGAWTTKMIRPPASYTTKLKKQQLAAHYNGYRSQDPSLYEEDHLISLTLGGNPTYPKNLWPQKWDGTYGAHVKDKLENRLHKLVCDGTLTLHQAQQAIAKDWIAAYKKYAK